MSHEKANGTQPEISEGEPNIQPRTTYPRTPETAAERTIRYEAQMIMRRTGKTMEDALIIATALIRQAEKDKQAAHKARLRDRIVRAEKRHDARKRGEIIQNTYGPALRGGAPGLGKRK